MNDYCGIMFNNMFIERPRAYSSTDTVKNIKDNIIDYLLDMLEEEHMGMREVAKELIRHKYGVDV